MSGYRFLFLVLYAGFSAAKTFPHSVGAFTDLLSPANGAVNDVDDVFTWTGRCYLMWGGKLEE